MSTNMTPATAVTKARKANGVAPVLDLQGKSKAELEAMVQSLFEKSQNTGGQFTIRFNDGSDPAPDRQVDGQTVAGSKRDSGTLSVYGFGRNPISLYAGQWLELLGQCAQPILQAISDQADHIDAYVAKKTGSHKNDINRAQLEASLAVFQTTEPEEVTEGETEGEGSDAEGDVEVDAVEKAD